MHENGRGTCWALVPIKRRDECKSRLTGLTGPARERLVAWMLESVLAALRSSRCIGRIAVVSPCHDGLPGDVLALDDPGEGLNAALRSAARHLRSLGATELLVMPADLPCARGADIDRLVCEGRRRGVGIAPDLRGSGTNGLYLALDRPFEFRFGDGSFAAHRAEAVLGGAEPAVLHTDGLAFDVDWASDLQRLAMQQEARVGGSLDPARRDAWAPTPHCV